MNRRFFLAGAAATTIAPRAPVAPLADGQTIHLGGAERVLSDIIAPAAHEVGHDIAARALADVLARGGLAPSSSEGKKDRWGRSTGAIGWQSGDGSVDSLQELLLEAGGARVHPQSDDFALIERCFAAEARARTAKAGLWALRRFAPLNANEGPQFSGFQIYEGAIVSASDRKGRVFVNFGADFRSDFTATVRAAAFRRWKSPPELSALAGRRAEVRGYVERINGPSIELKHELQFRLI